MQLASTVLNLNNIFSCHGGISPPLFIYNHPCSAGRLIPFFLKYIYLWVNWRHSQHMGRYQEGKLSSAIISPRALWIWRLSKKRSTNLTLIYSHLTASKVINLSLDRFRRCNYKLKSNNPTWIIHTVTKWCANYPAHLQHSYIPSCSQLNVCMIGKMDVRSKLVFTRRRYCVVMDFNSHTLSLQHQLHTVVPCSEAMNCTFYRQLAVYLTYYRVNARV